MRYEKIDLFPSHPEAYLRLYLHDISQDPDMPTIRPAMLVLPGGAYRICADRESEPIVFGYLQEGFNVFLLQYSLKDKAGDYVPFIEATHAISHIRTHAEEYHINPNQVFVVGFSAGGHLAASTATLWNESHARAAVSDLSEEMGKPNGVVLCYAAIESHVWKSMDDVFRMNGVVLPDDDSRDILSPDKYVSDTTPPAFIWHNADDAGVPVTCSIHYAMELYKHHVPFELRVYPEGNHGVGTGTPESCGKTLVASEWLHESARWIKSLMQL